MADDASAAEKDPAASADGTAVRPSWPARRAWRVLLVLAGICLGQALLYGPSLIGRRILLPLDLLAEPGVYLPAGWPEADLGPHDPSRSDLILQVEPERAFAAHELAAHRWPRWLPYEYGGVPMRFSVFSPLFLLKASTPSPVVLAWAQLLIAVIAGFGLYLFCRRVLGLGFWPAAIAAWCYPLTGFFVLWQGFPLPDTICWLPWLLTAIDGAAQGRRPGWVAAVAVTTAIMVVEGQLDLAALAFVAAAGYAGARAVRVLWMRRWRLAWTALWRPAVGLALGVMLAAPYVLPFLRYVRTGERIEQRAAGRREERPPVGLHAVPLVVWPDRDGRAGNGMMFFGPLNEMESAAAGFAGIVATLLLAPLAWFSRRHRGANVLCAVAVVLGIGWCANLPGWVHLLRLPPFSLLSFNRFVFIVGFAITAQAAIGLECLLAGNVRRTAWCAAPILACAALIVLALRSHVPESTMAHVSAALAAGRPVAGMHVPADTGRLVEWYRDCGRLAAAIAVFALLGWAAILVLPRFQRLFGSVLALAAVLELLSFGRGRGAQVDPALYYPRIPTLDRALANASGRIAGFFCLPANLAPMIGLADVRGYDAVEPARFTQLLRLAAHPRSPVEAYTSTQWLAPLLIGTPGGTVRVSPILDLLGVRYVVARGPAPAAARADFAGDDYWGVVNRFALPRVFVPRRLQVEPDPQARLRAMSDVRFNPATTAVVEHAIPGDPAGPGTATITTDDVTRITVAAHLDAPGLLVLADRWDAGWRAFVNGSRAEIFRADHALRGVLLPAGASSVVFEYAPVGFRLGGWIAGVAAGLLVALTWIDLRRTR